MVSPASWISRLVVMNLLLQVWGGLATYYGLSRGVQEGNPLLRSCMEYWGGECRWGAQSPRRVSSWCISVRSPLSPSANGASYWRQSATPWGQSCPGPSCSFG